MFKTNDTCLRFKVIKFTFLSQLQKNDDLTLTVQLQV